MEHKDKKCDNCNWNEQGYCQCDRVMLWDRGGYANFGVVSVRNYSFTNCCREGIMYGVNTDRYPCFWRKRCAKPLPAAETASFGL